MVHCSFPIIFFKSTTRYPHEQSPSSHPLGSYQKILWPSFWEIVVSEVVMEWIVINKQTKWFSLLAFIGKHEQQPTNGCFINSYKFSKEKKHHFSHHRFWFLEITGIVSWYNYLAITVIFLSCISCDNSNQFHYSLILSGQLSSESLPSMIKFECLWRNMRYHSMLWLLQNLLWLLCCSY